MFQVRLRSPLRAIAGLGSIKKIVWTTAPATDTKFVGARSGRDVTNERARDHRWHFGKPTYETLGSKSPENSVCRAEADTLTDPETKRQDGTKTKS